MSSFVNVSSKTITERNKGCVGCIALDAKGNCAYLNMFGVSRVKIKAFMYKGGGCPVKSTKEITSLNSEKAFSLYNEGKSDREIALALNVTRAMVQNWRKSRSLVANPAKVSGQSGKKSRINWKLAEALYSEGKTDPYIAEELGCSKSLVSHWRKRTMRPSNYNYNKK